MSTHRFYTFFSFFSPSQQGWGHVREQLRGTWLLAEVKLLSLSTAKLKSICFKRFKICIYTKTLQHYLALQ